VHGQPSDRGAGRMAKTVRRVAAAPSIIQKSTTNISYDGRSSTAVNYSLCTDNAACLIVSSKEDLKNWLARMFVKALRENEYSSAPALAVSSAFLFRKRERAQTPVWAL